MMAKLGIETETFDIYFEGYATGMDDKGVGKRCCFVACYVLEDGGHA